MDLLFPPLLLFALVASITPGPNNIMIMASGLNFGIRPSLPHVFGISLGFTAMFLAIGFGLGYVFELYPRFHEGIKIVGIVYLLYLSWLIANAAPQAEQSSTPKPFTFIQAALFQWVNPKAWIMGTSAIAAFTTNTADVHLQIVVIAVVFFCFTLPSVGVWLCLGRFLKNIISHPRQQRIFNIVMALLLVASITPLASELLNKYL